MHTRLHCKLVDGADHATVAVCHLQQRFDIAGSSSQRLFAQDIAACRQQDPATLDVRGHRRADVRNLRLHAEEHGVDAGEGRRTVAGCQAFGSPRVGIHNADNGCAFPACHSSMPSTHQARTNERRSRSHCGRGRSLGHGQAQTLQCQSTW